ncbi:MAG: hypothetical protein AAFX81_16850 [Pseudomonadota bacterium]
MRRVLVLALLLVTGACQGVGPRLIQADKVNYAETLLNAEKRQLLLNILRVHDADVPSVVIVDQIVAGYERRLGGSIGNTIARDLDFTGDFGVRAEGTFVDRPTYTFKPLRGANYARVILRPIPPVELAGLIVGGADLQTALGLALRRINGVPNESTGGTGDFATIVQLLESLRDDGRLEVDFEARERVFLSFARSSETADDPRVREVIERLRLDPAAERYEIVLGAVPRRSDELALLTRPLIEILSVVATGVAAPEAPEAVVPVGAPIRILSEGVLSLPSDAFVSATYRGRRYWIDVDDVVSKRAFSMLLLLTTIIQRDDAAPQAVLTIPVN